MKVKVLTSQVELTTAIFQDKDHQVDTSTSVPRPRQMTSNSNHPISQPTKQSYQSYNQSTNQSTINQVNKNGSIWPTSLIFHSNLANPNSETKFSKPSSGTQCLAGPQTTRLVTRSGTQCSFSSVCRRQQRITY